MKRKTLSTAVIAGIAGVAGIANISSAVNLNNDGVGQVLIYPYFTVNSGNQTLVSIVNTTNEAKAVKVRFLESQNSREVLDFNLYMSPFDVWTGALFDDAEGAGPGSLVTFDTSCTVPDIVGQTSLTPSIVRPVTDADGNQGGIVDFRNFAYVLDNEDDGENDLLRTREGHFEVIEMGVVTNATQGSATAATHVPSTGFPADCDQLNAAWAGDEFGVPVGYWAQDSNVDIDAPSGGLFGSASVVNVAEGAQVGYNADAIVGFFEDDSDTPETENLHFAPGNTNPSLNQGNFDNDDDGDINSLVFNPLTGNVVASEWSRPVDAVSAVYMHNEIYNEYALDSNLDASTEWVVTFPTKRFYVDQAIVGSTALPPFTEVFDSPDGVDGNGVACEAFEFVFYGREEETVTPGLGPIDFSPRPPGADPEVFSLCFETNVVAFEDQDGNRGSGLFNSPDERTLSGVFQNGWATFRFYDASDDNLNEHILQDDGEDDGVDSDGSGDGDDFYNGLPATGFAAQVVKNGTLSGGSTLANYAGLFRHRADRDISGS